jgi:fido (protein-threonine AMPylation protein)
MKITRPLFDDNADPTEGQQQILPTEIPPNLIGAKSAFELQMAEDTIAAFRSWELSAGDVYLPGKYDTKHLSNLHEHLVGNIYPIVGETRTDDLSYELSVKQQNPSHVLPKVATTRTGASGHIIALLPAAKVNAQLDLLASLLEKENYLMGHEKPAFVARLAEYYTQYVYIHPFTAATPHVLAAAFRLLGKQAGYIVEPEQASLLNEVVDAVVFAGRGSDKRRLIQVLTAVVEEAPGAEAALRRKITMQVLPAKLPE